MNPHIHKMLFRQLSYRNDIKFANPDRSVLTRYQKVWNRCSRLPQYFRIKILNTAVVLRQIYEYFRVVSWASVRLKSNSQHNLGGSIHSTMNLYECFLAVDVVTDLFTQTRLVRPCCTFEARAWPSLTTHRNNKLNFAHLAWRFSGTR